MKIINYNKIKHDIYTFNESNMVLCALPTSATELIPGIRKQAQITGWNTAGLWHNNIDNSGIPDWSGLSARPRGSHIYGPTLPTIHLRTSLQEEFNAGSSDPKFSDITNWNNGIPSFIIISEKHFIACGHFAGTNPVQQFDILDKDGVMHRINGDLITNKFDTNIYRITSITGPIKQATKILPDHKIKIYQILNFTSYSPNWEGLRIWHQVNNGMFVTTTSVQGLLDHKLACAGLDTTPTADSGLPILANAADYPIWKGDSGSPILATYKGETYLIGMSDGGFRHYSSRQLFPDDPDSDVWEWLRSTLQFDGITITLFNDESTSILNTGTPLSIDPYKSRFTIDTDLLIYNDTYNYVNMIYHGFYGGTSLQSQELNELQENIQNQLSLANTLTGNWLEYNNNINIHGEADGGIYTAYGLTSDIFVPLSPENTDQNSTNTYNDWYLYKDNYGYQQFIVVHHESISHFTYYNSIRSRIVSGQDTNWAMLSDISNSSTFDGVGANRFQRFFVINEEGIPRVIVNSTLPLQRFLDMDIYGFTIEKSHENTSIDNKFPPIPYITSDTIGVPGLTPFSAAGSIDELRTLTRDRWTGNEGLAGLAFQAGSLGIFQDNTYHSLQEDINSNYIVIAWTGSVDLIGTNGQIGDIVFQGDTLLDTTPEFQSSVGTITSIENNNIKIRFNTYSDHIDFYKNFKFPFYNTSTELAVSIRLYFNNKDNYITLTTSNGVSLSNHSGELIKEMIAKEGVFPKSGTAVPRNGTSAYLFNYFDLGDSAKKSPTQTIQRSYINKYQWFDWGSSKVKGSNNNSIASGYHGNYIISQSLNGCYRKINIPKGGYVQASTQTLAPYDIFRVNPTFEEIQTGNSNLIVNGKAKIRELYSGSLGPNSSELEETPPEFIHIDAITDDALLTLDTEGVVTILVRDGPSVPGTDLSNTVYFYKKILEKPGILTDENGIVNGSVPNKYINACMSHGFYGRPGWVWLLKENGKVYGFELKTATERDTQGLLKIKTENFNTPLGFAASTQPAININNIQETSDQAKWKTSTFIQYILNLIPKVNGIRLPVIDMSGGYGSLGQFTCAFPPEEGEETTITFADGKTHPIQNVQLIDIDKETGFRESVPIEETTNPGYSHLQRIKSTYNGATKSWSYPNNELFDVDVYNKIFGVWDDTTNRSYNIPPRGWGVERKDAQSWILSNNGILVVFNVRGPDVGGFGGSVKMKETGNRYWGMCVPKLPTIDTINNSTDKIILDGTFTNGLLPIEGGPFKPYTYKPLTNIFNRPNIIIDSTLEGVFVDTAEVLNNEDNFKIDLNNNSGHALLHFTESTLNINGGSMTKNVVVGCRVNGSGYFNDNLRNYYKHIPHVWTLDEQLNGFQLNPLKKTHKIIASAHNSTVIYKDFTWKIIGKPVNGTIPDNIKDIMFTDDNTSILYSGGDSVLVQNINNTISIIVPPTGEYSAMFESRSDDDVFRPAITNLDNVTYMVNHNDHGTSRVAIVTENLNTWKLYLYMSFIPQNFQFVYTGTGKVTSITINEYHCSFIILNSGKTSVFTVPLNSGTGTQLSPLPPQQTTGTQTYTKIVSTAISTVLLKQNGTFLKWINPGEYHLSPVLDKITEENILVDDIYLGFWHSAIIKARDTGNNNYLIFHSPQDQSSTQRGRFRNLPIPLAIGRWNHDLGKVLQAGNFKYKIIETSSDSGEDGYFLTLMSINGSTGSDGSDYVNMKDNIVFNKNTMFSIEPNVIYSAFAACHSPVRYKTVLDLKTETPPIFYPDDFSYDEWFGNTYAILDDGENTYPQPSIELKFLSNWINDSNIVEIIAFKDTVGHMPYTVIDGQVSRNQAYSPYCSMTLTNLGNSEKTKNPVAWARSYGHAFCWIRQNGAIFTHGERADEADHYIFAPMTWGTYPNIKNSLGDLYSDNTTTKYESEIEECKEIGKYIGQ